MRSSMAAQSWLSVPPAPGAMATMAWLLSRSPLSIMRSSASSTPLRRSTSTASASSSISASSRASSRPVSRSSRKVVRRRARAMSSLRRPRFCRRGRAASGSSQKPGTVVRSSICSSSRALRSGSRWATSCWTRGSSSFFARTRVSKSMLSLSGTTAQVPAEGEPFSLGPQGGPDNAAPAPGLLNRPPGNPAPRLFWLDARTHPRDPRRSGAHRPWVPDRSWRNPPGLGPVGAPGAPGAGGHRPWLR